MVIKKQHRDQMPLLILLWILGMGQGVMGWIMVKSGLNHNPHVSPYRLSAHLLLGFTIFGVLLWMTLRVCKVSCERVMHRSSLQKYTITALGLILLTVFFGALVAGHKAGLIYNTFPLMGDGIIPREFLTYQPWWKDLFENPVSVQFLHRLCAVITALYVLGLWTYQRHLPLPPILKTGFKGMMALVLLQLSLGILTLLYGTPPWLALLHQGVALLAFGSVVVVVFLLSSHSHKACTGTAQRFSSKGITVSPV
jgi:cytochrome c oxidase assembly protein subunit 15